jgi:hypothetical protein
LQDDDLQVKVNKLSSIKTQLPYDYYFLDYCKPDAIKNSAENLGEVLRGDRIENSVYNVSTLPLYFTLITLEMMFPVAVSPRMHAAGQNNMRVYAL